MKLDKIWIGLLITIAGCIFGYGRLCAQVEDAREDIKAVSAVQQDMIDKFYTAQMDMNALIYKHMAEGGVGEGD